MISANDEESKIDWYGSLKALDSRQHELIIYLWSECVIAPLNTVGLFFLIYLAVKAPTAVSKAVLLFVTNH